jgi:hypothetical protein
VAIALTGPKVHPDGNVPQRSTNSYVYFPLPTVLAIAISFDAKGLRRPHTVS